MNLFALLHRVSQSLLSCPSLRAAVRQEPEPSPLESQSFPCYKRFEYTDFSSGAVSRPRATLPRKLKPTIRYLLSVIRIAACARRLGAITEGCQIRNSKVLVEEY